MQEKHMRSFLEVARAGSFSKAAESLYLSVPALKKQMDTLENDLQVTLLVRTNNGVSLTKAGKAYRGFAQRMLDAFAVERAKLKQISSSDNSIIRFGFNTIDFNDPIYIYAFNAFKTQHPHVIIDFIRAPLLDADAYDLFIGTPQITPYQTHRLCSLPAMCILSKQHPLASKDILLVSDLNGQTVRTLSKYMISELAPELHAAFSCLKDTEILFEQMSVNQSMYHTYALSENAISIVFGRITNLPDMLTAIPLEDYFLSYELHVPHPIEKTIVAEYVDFITEYYRTHTP